MMFLTLVFFFECFPSLSIWPTYCILLSTFFSVLSNLSDSNLSDLDQEASFGGDEGTRTPGLCLAKAPLSQLSYIPSSVPVGLSGLEPETSPLSEARSNQLS